MLDRSSRERIVRPTRKPDQPMIVSRSKGVNQSARQAQDLDSTRCRRRGGGADAGEGSGRGD
eukprot:1423952-Prymnesium_polylepis.1